MTKRTLTIAALIAACTLSSAPAVASAQPYRHVAPATTQGPYGRDAAPRESVDTRLAVQLPVSPSRAR